MKRIKANLVVIFCLFQVFYGASQTIEISGRVIAPSDMDRIHIINKTKNRFTITNDEGEFRIPAQVNDTILFSAIQYEPKEVVVTPEIIQTKFITVNMSDKINELDEVVVGRILTGDLMSDIENSQVKRQINFYDLGIPGYTGKPIAQSQRRLHEATTGGGIVPLNPILNWISGRTKELKGQIEREKKDMAMNKVISEFSDLLFEIEDLEASKRTQYFYFVTDDPEFLPLSHLQNDLRMFEFLKQKLAQFKERIEED
ncbi:carboxypeptidase-like regulatory domain-containing protein [Psychroserpens sp. XS_ASV72]|uniref:carboxypeptidase-like regulatory domain-containing protein n=1 Tax=Psychroserpens sp. XS_ASV72 TaxID=3241293 RepID=UPI0035124578